MLPPKYTYFEINRTILADYLEQRKLHENPNYGVAAEFRSQSSGCHEADRLQDGVGLWGRCPKAVDMVTHPLPISGLTRSHRTSTARFAKWAPPSTAATSFAQTNWKMFRHSPIFGYDRDLNDTVLE